MLNGSPWLGSRECQGQHTTHLSLRIFAPSAGLEPAPPAPEAGALSAELRGLVHAVGANAVAIAHGPRNCSPGARSSGPPACRLPPAPHGPGPVNRNGTLL